MGNWYYIGRWVNVWNFRRKRVFFQNFNTFFCFENDLSIIFGFLTSKLLKVPIFMKIQWTKLKLWTKMHYHKFPWWLPRGQERDRSETVVQSFDCNRNSLRYKLKILYFYFIMTVCTCAPNFIEIWMWNFPKGIWKTKEYSTGLEKLKK